MLNSQIGRQARADVCFWAQIGHRDGVEECPFLGVKRTSRVQSVMSAFDPLRTLAACDQGHSAKAAI
jgi:hypothetical protein